MDFIVDLEHQKYFLFDLEKGTKSACDKFGQFPKTFTPYKSGFNSNLHARAMSPDIFYRIQPKKFDGYFQCPRPTLAPSYSKTRLKDDVKTLPKPVKFLHFSSIYDNTVSPPSLSKSPSTLPPLNSFQLSKTLQELKQELSPSATREVKTVRDLEVILEKAKINNLSFSEKPAKPERRKMKGMFDKNIPSSTELFKKEKKMLVETNPVSHSKQVKFEEMDRKYLEKRRLQKILRDKLQALPSHKSYLKALSTAIDLFWEGEKTSAIHIFKKAELELELSLGKVKTDEYLIGLEGLPKKWRDSLKNLLPKTKPTSSMEYFQEMKPKEDSFQASESDILLPDELLPEEELQIVLSLYKEDKILEAIDLLNSLKEKYQKDFEDNESIRNLISDYQIINEIYNNVQDKQNWTISKTGKVNVMYKKLENTKSYSVLAEGLIKAPLFNFISIIYENDLYHTWLPYCQSSSTISNLSKTRKIIFQEFDLPFLSSRHACLYAFGANLLQSKGVIVIASKSCDQQKSYKGIDLPQNLESKKAQVNIMGFIVKPLSEQEIHVTFLMNFDPILKSFTYKILNYFSRKISRAIFSKLGKLCKNFKGSLFETQLKAPENQEFYDYLNESLEEYLKSEVSK